MTLVDKGTGADLEFAHMNYKTGEGRFITHSENMHERYVNPELLNTERRQIFTRDMMRRNLTAIYLWNGNNMQIVEYAHYNHATEDLSLSWYVRSRHGKRLFDIMPMERNAL